MLTKIYDKIKVIGICFQIWNIDAQIFVLKQDRTRRPTHHHTCHEIMEKKLNLYENHLFILK